MSAEGSSSTAAAAPATETAALKKIKLQSADNEEFLVDEDVVGEIEQRLSVRWPC